MLALFFLGGVVIHDFALALLIGVVVGTYSSIFVASPIVYHWPSKKGKVRRAAAEKPALIKEKAEPEKPVAEKIEKPKPVEKAKAGKKKGRK